MNFRARSTGIFALRPTARSSRRTTRNRTGELDGAPTSREAAVCAVTGRTGMSGLPSASGPNSACRASTSGASLRQFLVSVACVPAVRAALR